MDDIIAELDLQDCFQDSSETLEVSSEQLMLLQIRIENEVKQNEIALNRSVDMVAAYELF